MVRMHDNRPGHTPLLPGSARYGPAGRTERGIALVIVLWVVTLLGIATGSYAFSVRTDTRIVDNLRATVQARAAAGAGVRLAVWHLINPDPAQAWHADATEYRTALFGASLRVTIVDEAGKIDLNHAPPGLLTKLLRAAGAAEDQIASQVDALLDWRDPDDLRRVNGAEQDDYVMADLDYEPSNGPFEYVDELARVRGMEPALFKRLRGALTVYSQSRGVDRRVAAPLVRRALAGLEDEDTSGMSELTDQAAPPAPAGRRQRASLQRTYSIHVEARMPQGAVQGVTAIIRLQSSGQQAEPYRVLAWKQSAEPGLR